MEDNLLLTCLVAAHDRFSFFRVQCLML